MVLGGGSGVTRCLGSKQSQEWLPPSQRREREYLQEFRRKHEGQACGGIPDVECAVSLRKRNSCEMTLALEEAETSGLDHRQLKSLRRWRSYFVTAFVCLALEQTSHAELVGLLSYAQLGQGFCQWILDLSVFLCAWSLAQLPEHPMYLVLPLQ